MKTILVNSSYERLLRRSFQESLSSNSEMATCFVFIIIVELSIHIITAAC